jgi:signal transduction histidine kinase
MSAANSDRSDRAGRAEGFLQDLNALLADAVRSAGDPAFLQRVLDAGMRAVGGRRGFLALVQRETGLLTIACASGEGWTEETRQMRLHLGQETRRGITGHVALTGRPYITGDVDSDPYYLRYFDDVKSEMAVPILSGQGQTRGVINIDSPEPDAFDSEDCSRLAALAQSAAFSLGIAGFRSREAALIEIGKNLSTTLEIEPLMKQVVDVASDIIQTEDCSVFLLDEQADHLVLQASRGTLGGQVGLAAYHIGEGLTGWVAQHAKPIRLEEPHRDPRWTGRYEEVPEEEIGAFLAVPIVSRDKVLGVLRVLRRKSHMPWFSSRFTETEERMLVTIASQLGVAIENARSYRRLVRTERMAAWGELSARSAHMIGNRTFALKGDLNELAYLIETLPPGEQKKELAAISRSMERGIERLEEILRDFRDFVVATQLTLAEADINAILREVVAESFPKRCCVQLRLELAEGIPPLRCDEKKLKRAFSELIENAVSFMPEEGELRIGSRLLAPEERGGFRLTHSRDYAQIEFADTGPGVPEDLKGRIFQPFYTTRVKGMGLGLSIVRGIIEAHQGLIREVGVPGKGARFLIFLPVN